MDNNKQPEATKVDDSNLAGKHVAILATDGFEQAELFEPQKALEKAGARTEILSIPNPNGREGEIKAWDKTDWGKSIRVDNPVAQARHDSFDALVLPGGIMNPDKLRQDPAAVAFVKAFVESGKPVAAICHGPWTLIEAGVVKDRTLTSWPSLKTDLTNAGAHWVDEEVHIDGNLITSRKPDDIPAFNGALIALIHTSTAKQQNNKQQNNKQQNNKQQNNKQPQQQTQPEKQQAQPNPEAKQNGPKPESASEPKSNEKAA